MQEIKGKTQKYTKGVKLTRQNVPKHENVLLLSVYRAAAAGGCGEAGGTVKARRILQ